MKPLLPAGWSAGALRRPTKIMSILIAAAGLIQLGLPQTQLVARAGVAQQPNVLVVVTDDQRVDIGGLDRTVDWFQNHGVVFTNAVATTPLCCPSRASIFSGRYAHNHGVANNDAVPLFNHEQSVQRYLHDAGYRTAIFGKFFNNWNPETNPPYFDNWAISIGNEYSNGQWNVQGEGRRVPEYSTSFIRDKALDLLADSENDDARPWLMFLTPGAPHMPATPHRRDRHAVVPPWEPSPNVNELDVSDKPPYISSRRHRTSLGWIKTIRKRQTRTLMGLDRAFMTLVETLEKNNELDDTLIFFISDNGLMWGSHRVATKRVPYLEATDVPLFMRSPTGAGAGAEDDRLAANIDLAPTILDASGITGEPVESMDGRSLLDDWSRDRILLEMPAQVGTVPRWASLRTKTYQYTEYYGTTGAIEFQEYYDLIADPYQMTNLLGDGNLTNDPLTLPLTIGLALDSRCRGQDCP